MEPKLWYESKTLWINAIAAVALIIQHKTGYLISPEIQAGLLIVANIIVRAITGKPVVFSLKRKTSDVKSCGCDDCRCKGE